MSALIDPQADKEEPDTVYKDDEVFEEFCDTRPCLVKCRVQVNGLKVHDLLQVEDQGVHGVERDYG